MPVEKNDCQPLFVVFFRRHVFAKSKQFLTLKMLCFGVIICFKVWISI